MVSYLAPLDIALLAAGSRQALASGGGHTSAVRDHFICMATNAELVKQSADNAAGRLLVERQQYDDWVSLCSLLREGGRSPDY